MSEEDSSMLGVPKDSTVWFSAPSTETGVRGGGWRNRNRRRLGPLTRSASAPTAAAAPQPNLLNARAFARRRASPGASLPSSRPLECVRA